MIREKEERLKNILKKALKLFFSFIKKKDIKELNHFKWLEDFELVFMGANIYIDPEHSYDRNYDKFFLKGKLKFIENAPELEFVSKAQGYDFGLNLLASSKNQLFQIIIRANHCTSEIFDIQIKILNHLFVYNPVDDE